MNELPIILTRATFYYRFVDSVGFGSCDGCYGIGPVNHICLHCCISEGMELGSCLVCYHRGPAWETCQWCERGHCVVSGYGECNNEECEWEGALGEQCSNCGDGSFVPVEPTHLCSNAAEVTLLVPVPSTVTGGIASSTQQNITSSTRENMTLTK